MTSDSAERAAARVGLITLVLGSALIAMPTRFGAPVGFADPRGARIVGLADLALVPGLLRGRHRYPWMAARVALNVIIIGYLVAAGRAAPRRRLAAASLLVATATDVPVLNTLRRADR